MGQCKACIHLHLIRPTMDTANQQQQTRVRKRAPNAYEDSSINSLARLLNPPLIRIKCTHSCSRCRQQKIKCSGNAPCGQCTKKNLSCNMDSEYQKLLVTRECAEAVHGYCLT